MTHSELEQVKWTITEKTNNPLNAISQQQPTLIVSDLRVVNLIFLFRNTKFKYQ